MSRKLKKYSRIFGFNKDRDGLITRYFSESEHWHSHLQNSKDFILKSLAGFEKKSVMLLGSGWLLDVPVDELSEHFQTVVLVDIAHPNQILHTYGKRPNLFFEISDISGVLGSIRNESLYSTKDICNDLKRDFHFDLYEKYNPDMVISLNLLSQIAHFPVQYAIDRMDIDNERAEIIRRCIQQLHIDHLPEGKSLIITDYHEYVYDMKDNLIEERPRLSVKLPESISEWTWDFDLSGNYKFRRKVRLTVAALQV